MEVDSLSLEILDWMSSHRDAWPIVHYEGILKGDPGNVRALNNKACFLAYMGCMAESVRVFDRALALEPDNVVALSNMAAVAGACGQDGVAADLLERILAIDPSDLGARVRCINLLTSLGRYGEALRYFGEMPRPCGMARMLLGSLSEEFRTLQRCAGRGRPGEMTVDRGSLARGRRTRGESGCAQVHLTLL